MQACASRHVGLPVHAGFTKLHKPVHFAETLSLTKRWMADSSPDYRGAEYTLVRRLRVCASQSQ